MGGHVKCVPGLDEPDLRTEAFGLIAGGDAAGGVGSGTTATGWQRKAGLTCCSQEAK